MDSTASSAPVSGPLAGLGLFDRTDGPVRDRRPLERLWWGVDPSTVRVSVAAVDDEGVLRGVRTHAFTRYPARSFERLAAIREETERFLRGLALELPPAFVLVEEPGGKWVEPQLSYAVGVIQSVVPARGALVPVSSWKKAGCGHGGIKKPQIMRWAQRHGYRGLLQDEADAVGIAFACRALRAPRPRQLALV